MNDGFSNSVIDTDSGEVFAENGEIGNDVQPVPESDTSNASVSSDVSDPVGSDILSGSDTESSTEIVESSAVDSSETGMETSHNDAQTSADTSVDYSYKLDNIEYRLMQQLDTMQSTKSVSGNSLVVSLDSASMETLTDMQQNQKDIITGQNALYGLLGCVLFALCADFIVHSVKRVFKNITGKGE